MIEDPPIQRKIYFSLILPSEQNRKELLISLIIRFKTVSYKLFSKNIISKNVWVFFGRLIIANSYILLVTGGKKNCLHFEDAFHMIVSAKCQ